MRNIIRKILQGFGYNIVKINQHNNSKAHHEVLVNVGGYKILMPGNNPQISNYKYFPNLNKQLSRLAKVVYQKYPEMHMVDIGANVGDTIAIVNEVLSIPILGIEGDAITYKFLKKNVSQFSNITIFNNYLSEKSVTSKVNFEKGGWNTTIVPNNNTGKQIDFLSFDDLIVQNNLQNNPYKLIKIDIEGYDTIALRGALQNIKKHLPVLYIEYNLENMSNIGETEKGLQTILDFINIGYDTIAFFDHRSNILLKTDLSNLNIINQLHSYGLKKNTCMPYYDICIFHKNDNNIAEIFLSNENKL